MALKYVASNTTYDFGKSEYATTSNKYKRLNYIANDKTYQIGLATDSTATQYSPLKMKINDSTYYIGRSSSRSASTSHVSTYSSRITRVNTSVSYYYAAFQVWTTSYVGQHVVGEVVTTVNRSQSIIVTYPEYSTATLSSSASSVTSMTSNNFV